MSDVRRRTFRLAFERDLLFARLATEPEPDGGDLEALRQIADLAWDRGDLAGFLAPARRLWAAGAMKPKLAIRLASALIDSGLPLEALEALSQQSPGDDQAFTWALETAGAALAADFGAAAEEALAQALRLADGEEQRVQARTFEQLLTVPSKPGMKAWAVVEAWIGQCLERSQTRLAARGFVQALGCMDEKAAARQLESICEAALTLLRLADPATAEQILAGMAGLIERLGFLGDLRATLAVMRRGGAFPTRRPKWPQPGSGPWLMACLGEACAAAGAWRAAGERFQAGEGGGEGLLAETLAELARCVGRDLLAQRPVRLAGAGAGRVFDLFPFSGEHLMLEMKLAEMGPWVEKFVLVEAAQTFRGDPKPLYFAEAKDRFAAHRDKIIHVVIDRFPDHLRSPWAREFYQRDMAAGAISGLCGASDILIISDVDEIVRERAIRVMEQPLFAADLRTFNYFLNFERVDRELGARTMIARGGLATQMGLSYLRIGSMQNRPRMAAADAGWHFSSVGDATQLARKFASYSHTEWSHLDADVLGSTIALVRSGGLRDLYAACPVDELPPFVNANRERLADLLV